MGKTYKIKLPRVPVPKPEKVFVNEEKNNIKKKQAKKRKYKLSRVTSLEDIENE